MKCHCSLLYVRIGIAVFAIGFVVMLSTGGTCAALGYQQPQSLATDASSSRAETERLNSHALVLYQRGETQAALSELNQVLSRYEVEGDHRREANTLGNIALVYERMGEYQEALAASNRALVMYREVGDLAGEALTLNNVAHVYQRLGEYPHALDISQQALVLHRRVGDGLGEATSLSNIGLIYGSLGQHARALEYFEQALAIERKIGDQAQEAYTLDNLASVFSTLGQPVDAVEASHEALALHRKAADRAGEASTLSAMGSQYVAKGDYEQALQYLHEALATQHVILDRRGEAVTLNNIGAVYSRLGKHSKALDYFQQALVLFNEIGDIAGEGEALDSIGSTDESLGRLQDALKSYMRSITVAENLRASARVDEFKSSLAEQFTGVYQRATLLLVRLDRPVEAFQLTERARARTFLDQIGNAHVDASKGGSADPLEKERRLNAALAELELRLRQERANPLPQQNADLIQSLAAQVTAKQKEYQDTLAELKLANPEYASLRSIAPPALSEVQKLLSKEVTLISYFVTRDKTLVFVISRDWLKVAQVDVTENNLKNAISEFRSFASVSDWAPESLAELSRWLIAPIKPDLRTPILGIVPNGVLNNLPFAVLRYGEHYIGDEYSIFYLPSASTLRFVPAKPVTGHVRLLALAASRPEGLPALRYAETEVKDIGRLFDSQVFVGSAATKPALLARASGCTILHLAAHGRFEPNDPLFSRIILAPSANDDGVLTVNEIYGLNLMKVNLVVLSTSQAGLGAENPGDETAAFDRAFIYAGASSVIASLWSVSDQATSVFMMSFYTHLRQGMAKADALRVAQAETRARYPHPYYWAAFRLTGDPGNLLTLDSDGADKP